MDIQYSTNFSEYLLENWVWDRVSKPPDVLLSSDFKDAYFFTDPVEASTGSVAVRGSKGFSYGEHYWEIIFLEPPAGTSVMVGIGTARALLQTTNYHYINLLGNDKESWGLSYKGTLWHDGKSRQYCQPFYKETTVIGCHLDLYRGTLTYYRNGENLGVAFTGLGSVEEPLYPLISSTTSETELGLGVRSSRFLSLQDKCFAAIKKGIACDELVDRLPLPHAMKNHLKEM